MFLRNKQENKQKTGTAYLITYAKSNRVGHSALYVEGPDNENFYQSFYPSYRNLSFISRILQSTYLSLFLPTRGFIGISPEWDVQKIQKAAPVSIYKIEGVDYQAMKDAHTDIVARTNAGQHAFSLHYKVHRPLVFIKKGMYYHNQERDAHVEKYGQHPSDCPFSGALIADDSLVPQDQQYPQTFGNCSAHVAFTLFKSGALNSVDKSLASTVFGKYPSLLYLDVSESKIGEEMLDGSPEKFQQLPQRLQQIVEEGHKIQQANLPLSDEDRFEEFQRIADNVCFRQ